MSIEKCSFSHQLKTLFVEETQKNYTLKVFCNSKNTITNRECHFNSVGCLTDLFKNSDIIMCVTNSVHMVSHVAYILQRS